MNVNPVAGGTVHYRHRMPRVRARALSVFVVAPVLALAGCGLPGGGTPPPPALDLPVKVSGTLDGSNPSDSYRFNLSDGVLIKDNHIAPLRERGAGSLGTIVMRARAAVPHTMRIEIEVTTPDEAAEAADGGADIILLDNMDLAAIRESVRRIGGRALIEASGGITLDNVRDIAEAGVDFISVGRLTHSAPALDISLELQGV